MQLGLVGLGRMGGNMRERIREALKRDWYQTKADLSLPRGRDLDQGIWDTVRQALGTEPLPLPSQRTPRGGGDLDAEAEKVLARYSRLIHGDDAYTGRGSTR